jgi:hypothetical protein
MQTDTYIQATMDTRNSLKNALLLVQAALLERAG